MTFQNFNLGTTCLNYLKLPAGVARSARRFADPCLRSCNRPQGLTELRKQLFLKFAKENLDNTCLKPLSIAFVVFDKASVSTRIIEFTLTCYLSLKKQLFYSNVFSLFCIQIEKFYNICGSSLMKHLSYSNIFSLL